MVPAKLNFTDAHTTAEVTAIGRIRQKFDRFIDRKDQSICICKWNISPKRNSIKQAMSFVHLPCKTTTDKWAQRMTQ